MKNHQISLSHWGIFWCKFTYQMEVNLKGYDARGKLKEESIAIEIFHYEPLQYTDDIDYEELPVYSSIVYTADA